MDEKRLAFYALSLVPNLGPKRCLAIYQSYDDLNDLYSKSLSTLKKLRVVPKNVLPDWDPPKFMDIAHDRMVELEKQGHTLVLYCDKNYPSRLKHIPSPPLSLYAMGDLTALSKERCIGIVGTRKPSAYGAELVRTLVTDLTASGAHVISGMAFGIDAIAHRAALDCGLLTTAILGGALDKIYPSQHSTLARNIAESGCLLTEHFLGTTAEREFFPMRNRIIAGLSDIVVVGESKERGGSMITAWMANDFQREVAAFPGDVMRPTSSGCNLLIKTNQAHLIEGAQDVLKLMRWDEDGEAPTQLNLFQELDDQEVKIINELKNEKSLHVDQLSVKLDLPVAQISHLTFQLEMKGLVTCISGNRVLLGRT